MKAELFNLAMDVVSRPQLEEVHRAISTLSNVDNVGDTFDKLGTEDA